ncbi:hypothetical protein U1Q18_026669 [Sarracenia purpurea var. burkii]
MAGYLSMKMKRKDLEDVNDEFSDFSLSSPARKIRRLDAELPPIMEEEEPEVPLIFEQQVTPEEHHLPSIEEQVGGSGPIMQEFPSVPKNEERAIVLFTPMNTPLLQSPSNFSVSVNSDIISGIKNHILWSSQCNTAKEAEDEAARLGLNTKGRRTNDCLAVVPWVPSAQVSSNQGIDEIEVSELMESEEDQGVATMEIEEENNGGAEPVLGQGLEFSGMMSEGLIHQWQQQHCMIPQLPQNSSTPISWYR